MLITMFTDAGFDHQLKLGVWAAWAKADGVAMRRSGVLRSDIPNVDVAELQAIANGLACIVPAMAPPAGSKIIAQTDSLNAIRAIKRTAYCKPASFSRVENMLTVITKFTTGANLVVEWRHVRAHQGTGTPRNAVNEWCDGECRRLLRDARVQKKLA